MKKHELEKLDEMLDKERKNAAILSWIEGLTDEQADWFEERVSELYNEHNYGWYDAWRRALKELVG